MINAISELLIKYNQGQTNDRLDNADISCCIMFLTGIDQNTAYFLTKCKGLLSETIINQRAENYFESTKIQNLIAELQPIVMLKATPKQLNINEPIDALTPEELEKMGTVLLRSASTRHDVDTKEINDLIKMLDSVGALPKKQKDEKDLKQVIINPLYNTVCEHCRRETYIQKQ